MQPRTPSSGNSTNRGNLTSLPPRRRRRLVDLRLGSAPSSRERDHLPRYGATEVVLEPGRVLGELPLELVSIGAWTR
jgi:hypothetical protein